MLHALETPLDRAPIVVVWNQVEEWKHLETLSPAGAAEV